MANRQPLSLTGLTGEEGLLAAVIVRAVKDATASRRGEDYSDAWAYLAGDVFEWHTEVLGLPAGQIPAVIADMAKGDG